MTDGKWQMVDEACQRADHGSVPPDSARKVGEAEQREGIEQCPAHDLTMLEKAQNKANFEATQSPNAAKT